jgi:aryl-alcohol dehydrogenase-like predicted oxidoreductase
VSEALPTAVLGRTGLEVTRLSFGAMEIRGPRIWNGRPVTDQQAETILNAVLDEGINFIDTANDYGRSEEFIGKYIAHRRKEFYLATKCGCTVVRKDEDTDETPHVWTRDNLFRGLNESLQRMKTDYIDIMQLHNPPVDVTEQDLLVDVLKEMQQQGKVRFISISTTLPHLPVYLKWGVFDTFQIPYSALEREHEEWISRTAEAGIGTIIRGGVARGEVGIGRARRKPHCLPPALHAISSGCADHHRRDALSGASAGKYCCRKTGASSDGCLRGGKTPAGSGGHCSRSNRLIPLL